MTAIPDKDERQTFEIHHCLQAYYKLTGRKLAQVRSIDGDKKHSQPDYLAMDRDTGEELIVELTSAYINDRSFIDRHWQECDTFTDIPFNKKAIERYQERVLAQVLQKVRKAEKYPADGRKRLLSVYLNEHEGVFIKEDDWVDFFGKHQCLLDRITTLDEILLWINRPGGEDDPREDYKAVLIKLDR